jgi:hypothetical protein
MRDCFLLERAHGPPIQDPETGDLVFDRYAVIPMEMFVNLMTSAHGIPTPPLQ